MSDLRLRSFSWYDQAFARRSAVRDVALPRRLAAASRVVFERSGICEVGAAATAAPYEAQLRPETDFYVGHIQIGLSGRTAPAAGRRLRKRASRSWSDGSVLIVRDAGWIPADCWTPRIFAEAGRRLFMGICDAPELPEFKLPNRWSLAADREGAIAQLRADAEDAVFEDWRLSAKGIEQFARFGRDPARPLP